MHGTCPSADCSLSVRAKENIHRDQQMTQFTGYKEFLFAKYFSTRETVYAQSIAISQHKPTYNQMQYKTKYFPLYYEECRQCIINC